MIIAIVESSLELVPKELASCTGILKRAKATGKKPTEVLLDVHYARGCITKLNNWRKRGRPDLVHRTLLVALDSPLAARGHIEAIYMHTLGGRWFYISPNTRLPRNYLRFVGLMEQLLKHGKVPRKDPLIYELKKPPKFKEPIFRLDPRGEIAKPEELSGFNGTLIVGGFPHGDFIKRWPGRPISVAREVLSASQALCIPLAWIYGSLI